MAWPALPLIKLPRAGLDKMAIGAGLMKWPSDKVAGLDKVAIGACPSVRKNGSAKKV